MPSPVSHWRMLVSTTVSMRFTTEYWQLAAVFMTSMPMTMNWLRIADKRRNTALAPPQTGMIADDLPNKSSLCSPYSRIIFSASVSVMLYPSPACWPMYMVVRLFFWLVATQSVAKPSLKPCMASPTTSSSGLAPISRAFGWKWGATAPASYMAP